jgi:hypothetical protein
MTDIVEKLRYMQTVEGREVAGEAADEIERLRRLFDPEMLRRMEAWEARTKNGLWLDLEPWPYTKEETIAMFGGGDIKP